MAFQLTLISAGLTGWSYSQHSDMRHGRQALTGLGSRVSQAWHKDAAAVPGGHRAVVRIEEINARLEGTRTSVSVYWLAVAIYLLVYLFPVPFAGSERVFKQADHQSTSTLQQDWRSCGGGDPLVVMPSHAHPANEHVARAPCAPRHDFADRRFSSSFDARGPPTLV